MKVLHRFDTVQGDYEMITELTDCHGRQANGLLIVDLNN